MTDDPARETVADRIVAAALFFGVLVPVVGVAAGWDLALYLLELIGLLGAISILVLVLGSRLIEYLRLPAWMTPRRLARTALLVAWAIVFGLLSGWLFTLQLAALLVLYQLILWFYDNKASERVRRVMRPVGYVLGTAAMVAFVAALAGWW